MTVPEKYLQLSAAFQVLKSALGSVGIKQLDVEGILTGDTMAFISILRHLPLPPAQTVNSDYKLVSGVFKFARSDLSLSPKLSVEQFLLSGSFTLRKMEFVTDLVQQLKQRNLIDRKYPFPTNVARESTPPLPSRLSPSIVVEDEPDQCPSPVKSLPIEPLIEKLLHSVHALSDSVAALESRLDSQFENVEAKIALLEGRLRIIDKLSGHRGN